MTEGSHVPLPGGTSQHLNLSEPQRFVETLKKSEALLAHSYQSALDTWERKLRCLPFEDTSVSTLGEQEAAWPQSRGPWVTQSPQPAPRHLWGQQLSERYPLKPHSSCLMVAKSNQQIQGVPGRQQAGMI